LPTCITGRHATRAAKRRNPGSGSAAAFALIEQWGEFPRFPEGPGGEL
jgi:hypothetical protein